MGEVLSVERRPRQPPFTLREAEEAFDAWGCNCGPAALAAICGLTLDAVRPHLTGFDEKRYTNPTMMLGALRRLDVPFVMLPRVSGPFAKTTQWPTYGLARIQWEGPWCGPGVPPAARYRYTHWIGAARGKSGMGVFDVNCLNNVTGWVSREDWERDVVPHLTAEYKRANGGWHVTHAIEVGHG